MSKKEKYRFYIVVEIWDNFLYMNVRKISRRMFDIKHDEPRLTLDVLKERVKNAILKELKEGGVERGGEKE